MKYEDMEKLEEEGRFVLLMAVTAEEYGGDDILVFTVIDQYAQGAPLMVSAIYHEAITYFQGLVKADETNRN